MVQGSPGVARADRERRVSRVRGEPPLSPSAPEDGPKVGGRDDPIVSGRGNRQESLLEAGKTVFVVDDLSTGSGR